MVIRLLPLLLLTGCATVRDHATCGNAWAALRIAEQAAAKICPAPLLAR
jgi:uncharacterized protein YceK